jgi:hypothetical protein
MTQPANVAVVKTKKVKTKSVRLELDPKTHSEAKKRAIDCNATLTAWIIGLIERQVEG